MIILISSPAPRATHFLPALNGRVSMGGPDEPGTGRRPRRRPRGSRTRAPAGAGRSPAGAPGPVLVRAPAPAAHARAGERARRAGRGGRSALGGTGGHRARGADRRRVRAPARALVDAARRDRLAVPAAAPRAG